MTDMKLKEIYKIEATQEHQDFFEKLAGISDFEDELSRRQRSCLAEINELKSKNQWQEILDLFYPLDEKDPDLVEAGFDIPLRKGIAFALGQLKKFDEAIKELEICLKKEPDSFQNHLSLGFTLYNSLMSAKNREILITPQIKKERIAKAHYHFKKAQMLKPYRVTPFYREAMLFKSIENKPRLATSLFEKAVSNWEKYTDEQKQRHHQEYKNYIKSLYNLAICRFIEGRSVNALNSIKKCIELDKEKDFINPEHKYFSLGKIYFALKKWNEAKDSLEFAATFVEPSRGDFILELLARTYLKMEMKQKALEVITKIPKERRKPFVIWTQADILLSLNQRNSARQILIKSTERDRKSSHRAYVKLSKIAFQEGKFDETVKWAEKANEFHISTYTTPDKNALIWMCIGYIKLGNKEKAVKVYKDLADFCPNHPYLIKIKRALNQLNYL